MWNTAGVSGSGGFDLLMHPCYIRNGYSQLGRTNLHPPSAQLIEPSAVALLRRCGTISRSTLSDLKKQKPRQAGPRVMLGVEAVLDQTGLIRCASVGLSDGAKSAYEAHIGTRGSLRARPK